MPLTPYEFGLTTGRLQAQLHTEIEEQRIEHLAHILGIEERTEFAEGYRNGFTAGRKLAEETAGIEPSDEEIEETYEEYLEKDRRKFEQEECYTLLPAEAAVKEEPEWLPSAAELDELEESLQDGMLPEVEDDLSDLEEEEPNLTELEESHEAYRQMARDEMPIRPYDGFRLY